MSCRRHLCRDAEAVPGGPQTIVILQLQHTDNVVDVSCAAARRARLSISPARLRSAPHLAVWLRTRHSARSSNRARQSQLIRAELPSNGNPQPSGSSKNARQWHFVRAERSSNGSSPSLRALEGSTLPSCFALFVFLPRPRHSGP